MGVSGAKQVAVQRSSQTIKGTDLVDMAQSFLHKHYACPCEFVATPLRAPKDILIEQKATNIQLVPRLIRGASPSSVKVQITVTYGIKKQAQQEIPFRLQVSHCSGHPGHCPRHGHKPGECKNRKTPFSPAASSQLEGPLGLDRATAHPHQQQDSKKHGVCPSRAASAQTE